MKLIFALFIILIGIARCCLANAHPFPAHVVENVTQSFVRVRALHRDVTGGYRQGLGSGFVVTHKGGNTYVLTCYHVVHAPDGYIVDAIFAEREGTNAEYYPIPAEIQYFDAANDLVLLRIADKVGYVLPVGVNPEPYTDGMGFGSPAAHLPFVYPVIFGGSVIHQNKPRIRITGHVAFGLSGSPVVDRQGRVRGVMSQAIMDFEAGNAVPGFGLAIPAILVRKFLHEAGL